MIRPFLNPDRHRLGGDEIPGMIDKGAVHGAAVQVHGLPFRAKSRLIHWLVASSRLWMST